MERTDARNDEASLSPWQNPGWYRATTLSERAASFHTCAHNQPSESSRNREKAQRRVQHWKEQPPFDEEDFFAKRLALDGLTEQELLALLGEPIEALQARLTSTPHWLVQLQQVFANFDASSDLPSSAQLAQEGADLAYLQPIRPLLQHGLKQLETGIQNLVAQYTDVPFDPQTIPSVLFANLIRQVLPKLSRTFALELNVALLEGRLAGATPEEYLQSYCLLLSQPGNLLVLLREYSVLARQLMTDIEQWSTYSLEFLGYLCADWQALREIFAPESDPGILTSVSGGTGVSHREGRSVLLLAFSSGLQLVYKPRSLALDVHFQHLLGWLNTYGQQPCFRTLKLLDRGMYGWSEFIAPAPRQLEEEARFNERLGAYLALLYMLGATHFQADDIIAAGEHPMLVNLGTVFQPRIARNDLARWQHPADQAYSESVLRVGLLSSNPSPDYSNHTITGFANVYRLLAEHCDELLETVLPRFAHDEAPLLVRPTNVYALILSKSFHPNVLRDALQRDRYLDRLWSSVKEKPHLAGMIAAERASLLRGDVPVFTTYPDSCDLFTDQGERIPGFFAVSGLKAVRQRLSQFDGENLARQTSMLRASFAGISMGTNPKSGRMLLLRPSQMPLTRQRLVGAACAVGERLCDLAKSTGDAAGWLGMTLSRKGKEKGEWVLLPTGATLYDGTAGITLFLAYLGYITGEKHYTLLARSALKMVHITIEHQKKTPWLTGIGAFNGWGAFIYLFTHLGVLWNEPAFLQEARKLAAPLVDLIEKDNQLDIISGSAGCIAALLSLYTIDPSASILAGAIQCGNHLLARAQPMKEGVGWYTISEDVPLAGFSHGAAGISWSLLSLAAVSGQERFRQVAMEALAYERSLFSPEKQNWPDLRPEESSQVEYEPRYMSAWCHGASGIGLGRLASLPNLNDGRIREEIAIALNTTIRNGFGYNHSLCHGDLGNLEPLLVAAQMLGDQQYYEQLQEMSSMLLESVERGGWVTGVPLGTETPGLMNGLAGIGYELLRLAEPEKVPSVLVLAPPTVPSATL